MVFQMAGVDYETTRLDVREAFSLQNELLTESLEKLKASPEIGGAVILSTCNRTELYLSVREPIWNLAERFCSLKSLSFDQYGSCIVERKGDEVTEHLFRLACGMKSRVFGEDQIVTQVKSALAAARECDATDYFLEKLFMNAISAAKKIKQSVHLTAVEDSVVTRTRAVLQEEFGDIRGRKCLVIGNGMIGRMAARMLVRCGADVMMTIRNYKTRQVEIPAGCRIVDYKDRYDIIAEYDAVISATTSPYCTVNYEDCGNLFLNSKKKVLVDLAVPRDISEEFAELPNVCLYNIDTLGGANTGEDNEGVRKALEIIREYREKLVQETAVKDYYDMIREIERNCGEITYRRIETDLQEAFRVQDEGRIREVIAEGSGKTAAALIYRLNKILPPEEWGECVEVLSRSMRAF